MFEKLIRALFGEPKQTTPDPRIHESAQLVIVTLADVERYLMYSRIADHQRLIEIEEDLYGRF